jgi:hypothetical protein
MPSAKDILALVGHDNLNEGLMDLQRAEILQVQVGSDNQVWINVDGVCLVRIGHVETLDLDQHGSQEEE